MLHKVLLIDDDADDREFFCEAIAEIAPEITCNLASDGRKAIAKLGSGEFELPDIIFIDVNMPVVNGWDCLLSFKKQEDYKNTPVIMYSTSSSHADIDKAAALGAFSFFTKPADFKELKKSLEVVFQGFKNGSVSSTSSGDTTFRPLSK